MPQQRCFPATIAAATLVLRAWPAVRGTSPAAADAQERVSPRRSDCSPDCAGECFEGHCLFQGKGLEDEQMHLQDMKRQRLPDQNLKSTGSNFTGNQASVLHSSRLNALLQESKRGLEGLAQRQDPAAQSLEQSSQISTAALPQRGLNVLEQRPDLAAAAFTQQRLELAATPGAPPVASVASPVSLRQGEAFGAGAVATAESVMVRNSAESTIAPYEADELPTEVNIALKARLKSLEADVSKFATENSQLRQQLSSWHKSGAQVAAREKRLGQLLMEAGLQSGAFASRQPYKGTALQQTGAKRSADNEGSELLPLEVLQDKYNTIIVVEVAILLLILYIGYKSRWYLCSAKEVNQQEMISRSGIFQNIGRELGITDYLIEASEVQIGNIDSLTIVGHVYVSIRVGHHEPALTSTRTPQRGSRSVQFGEVFQISIGKVDRPCVISLIDRDELMEEVVAHAEIPASELVSMAKDKTEFFSFSLKPQRHRLVEEVASQSAPYLALRLREASGETCARAHPDRRENYGTC